MAAPVVESSIKASEEGSDTLDFTFMADIASGELLLACCQSGTVGTRDFDAKTGWTELFDYNFSAAGLNGSHQIFYKVADGTESGADTWGIQDQWTRASLVMLRISGAEDPATTPIVYVTSVDGASGSATAPAAVATDDDSLSIRCQGRYRGGLILTCEDHAFIENAQVSNTKIDVWEDVVPAGSTGTKSVTYSPTWWSSPSVGHSVLLIAPPASGGSNWPGPAGFIPSTKQIFGSHES